MFSQIVRKTLAIGIATFVSRVLGFFRDILIAFFFGTSDSAQAFVVAFRLPNIWRSFVGEEAVNTAVVPVLSEYWGRGKDEDFWKLSISLLKFSLVFLLSLAIIGSLVAPILVKLIAPGFVYNSPKYHLCVKLTRIIFPYIFLIGMTAVVAGIVISRRIFWSYAWAPVTLNIAIIISLIVVAKKFGIYALALGVIIGGIIELILQWIALNKERPHRVKSTFFHPEYKRIFNLLIPRFLGASVYQINIFIDTVLASLEKIVGYGGIAGLYYAQRFVQLPLAIFATSLATAILPYFSENVVTNSWKKLSQNLSLSLRTVFFFMIPSAFILTILSKEIISTFFEYGRFSSYSTSITSSALSFYALGIFLYAGIKILVSTFYSLQKPMIPVKISLLSLIVNASLSIILMFPLKLAGICLATSIAAGFNFLLLYIAISKIIKLSHISMVYHFLRIFLSAIIMSFFLISAKCWIGDIIDYKIIKLFILLLLAVIGYIGASLIFNYNQTITILKWRKKR